MTVIDAFMQAIDDRNAAAFDALMTQNAYSYRIVVTGDSTTTGSSPLKGNFGKDRLKERFREGQISITVTDHIAQVSGPYDFWINDKFSHCGYETFTLIKEKADWKITSLTYSVKREGCKK
ncbi:MAG: hypothetical protein HEP71_10945 [Roseivirga sp.]|nr:hypothetical protein [Roseivirga sp.]